MKKSYFVLFLAVLVIGVFFFAGCSSKTDSSPLELYVSSVTPLTGSYSGAAVPVSVSLRCTYSGTFDVADIPSGITINKVVNVAQGMNGNAISGITESTYVITSFIDVEGSNYIKFDDIMWDSLSNYCAANTGSLVVHMTFSGKDTAGNNIETSGNFTLSY